jgi:hypothetical protein
LVVRCIPRCIPSGRETQRFSRVPNEAVGRDFREELARFSTGPSILSMKHGTTKGARRRPSFSFAALRGQGSVTFAMKTSSSGCPLALKFRVSDQFG